MSEEQVITLEIAKNILLKNSKCNLEGFTEIKDDAARILIKLNGKVLNLSGLKNILAGTAEILAVHDGGLSLNGLTNLSREVAVALAKHNGFLELNCLTHLEDDAAEIIAKHKGNIYLNGLKSLTINGSLALSKHKGFLSLKGVDTLSSEVAEALSKHEGDIDLHGLVTLSDETAMALSKHQGMPYFGSLVSLMGSVGNIALAERFANYRGNLYLPKLASVSDGAANALSKHNGNINLRGIKNLLDSNGHIALAKRFVNKVNCLDLGGLNNLGDEIAQVIATHRGEIILSGLNNLSDGAARALANHNGDLILSGLTSISVNAATSLANHLGNLWLTGLTNIEPEVSKIFKNRNLKSDNFSIIAQNSIKQAQKELTDEVRYPSLLKARKSGCTFLRSVWSGFGDDGMFSYSLFKSGRQTKIDVDLDDEILSIVEENNFQLFGEGNGSVGVLEIDLESGKSTFYQSNSETFEDERFAEFLLKCSWVNVKTIGAKIYWILDEDMVEDNGSNRSLNSVYESDSTHSQFNELLHSGGIQMVIKMHKGLTATAKRLEDELSQLLCMLEWIEDGQDLLSVVRNQCGLSLDLTIDVEQRVFCFAGNGKFLNFKVPLDSLVTEHFIVDLGIKSDNLNINDGSMKAQSSLAVPACLTVNKTRRFEFIEGCSAKYWETDICENQIINRWGRIGSKGQQNVKEFSDSKSAIIEQEELINEKIRKGYQEVLN